MKVMKTLFAIGVLTASFAPQADVGLRFHNEVSPIIVDGEEVGFRVFGTPEYQLEDGTNQIVFRVSKLVEGTTGEREKYNSKPYVMTFNAKDLNLYLAPSGKITRKSHAKAFDEKPTFSLTDESGKQLDYSVEVLPASQGITRDYTKELAKFNKDNGIEVKNFVDSDAANINSTNSAKMIQYWLDKATAEESETFVNWAFANRTVANPQSLEGSKALSMLSHWYSEAGVDQRKQILAWLVSQ